MTTTKEGTARVILLPVQQRARVEVVQRGRAGWRQLEELLDSTMFGTMLLARRGRRETTLLFDDDGIANERVPHLLARGALIFGTAALVQFDIGDGEHFDFDDESLEGWLAELSIAKWDANPTPLLAHVPSSQLAEALDFAQRAHEEGVALARASGKYGFVIDAGGVKDMLHPGATCPCESCRAEAQR